MALYTKRWHASLVLSRNSSALTEMLTCPGLPAVTTTSAPGRLSVMD